MLIRLFLVLPHLLKILVDGGYKQGVIDWGKAMFGYLLEVVKRPELHACKVAPVRTRGKPLENPSKRTISTRRCR